MTRFRNMDCNDLNLPTMPNISTMYDTLLNSKVSKDIHDQGESLFCWAFAISSMIRQSLKLFIRGLKTRMYDDINEAISKLSLWSEALEKLKNPNFHRQLRNELIMLPIPKIKRRSITPLDQGHYLLLAIERVSDYALLMQTSFLFENKDDKAKLLHIKRTRWIRNYT